MVLLVLVGVQGPQQPQDSDDLATDAGRLLRLQEGEEDVQQVGVLVVGLDDVARGGEGRGGEGKNLEQYMLDPSLPVIESC